MTGPEAQSAVANGIQQLIDDPTQWQRWADTQAKFHQYSPGNALLIALQRPDASHVAGFQTWKGLDRHVIKGEHGITILAPVTRKVDEAESAQQIPSPSASTTAQRQIVAFRPATVFDIAQTEGRPLELPEAHALTGNHLKAVLDALTQHAIPVPVQFAPLDPEVDGYGHWQPQKGAITVTTNADPNQQLKTLLHEWSHSIGVPQGSSVAGIHRGQEEVSAELTAYIVAKRLGLDTKAYSQAYIAGWGDMNPEKVKATLTDVSRRVKAITDTIEQSRDPLLQQVAATWNSMAPQRQPLQAAQR